VAVTAVAIDGGTPAVQSASAKTIGGALRALTQPTGSILHIDATTTQTTPGQPTYTWRQELYEQTTLPYLTRIIDKHLPGTPSGTEAAYGIGTEQTYDPRGSCREGRPERVDDVLGPALLRLTDRDAVVHEGAQQRVDGEL
jgi:hypothetical protein